MLNLMRKFLSVPLFQRFGLRRFCQFNLRQNGIKKPTSADKNIGGWYRKFKNIPVTACPKIVK